MGGTINTNYFMNPALMEDTYANSMYASIYNNQTQVGNNQQQYKSGATPSFGGKQATNNGSIWGPIFGGLAAGGAAYGGMTLLNHDWNSPIELVEGKPKFNERFLNQFSGEYAAVSNSEEIEKFYKSFENAGVKPENIEKFMTDFEKLTTKDGLKEIETITGQNEELKKFLINKKIISENGRLKKGKKLNNIQDLFIEKKFSFDELKAKNNYRVQSGLLERANGLEEAMKACGNDAAKKREFLLANADVLGLNENQIKELKFGSNNKKVNNIFKNIELENIQNELKTNVSNIKSNMQEYANLWNQDARLCSKGKFNLEGKLADNGKMWDALTNSVKKMRRGKAWPIALVVGIVAALGIGLARKNS